MKLLSIKYENTEQEWNFDKISFFDLTLLVGVSGVGKTQILDSIYSLKRIATGESINGVKWEVNFQILNGKKYTWRGAFEKMEMDGELIQNFLGSNAAEKNKFKIIFEELITDTSYIIKRTTDTFFFKQEKMPKLNSNESALNILKEEDSIKEIYDSFKLIILRDNTKKEDFKFNGINNDKLTTVFDTLEKIKKSDLGTFNKFALVHEVSKSTFNEIKNRFIDVFPQVKDVKIENIREEGAGIVFQHPVILIKEEGVDKWIPHNRMSSGMLRTLLHIAEMYLWNPGTVILIDEFENSLGLNCIDVLTEDLLYGDSDIQFIATSHHPYIINKIPYDFWKIVTRKGRTIRTFDAKEFNLGKSHHDQFMSLINHPFYKQGIS